MHFAGSNAMATDYRWNSHSRIVDIGGAYGSFMAHLLSINQKPRGVLFDQPQVDSCHTAASSAMQNKTTWKAFRMVLEESCCCVLVKRSS